jgi:hypothetical protein
LTESWTIGDLNGDGVDDAASSSYGGAKRYVLGGRAGQNMEISTTSHGEPLLVSVTGPGGQAQVVSGENGGLSNNTWVRLPSSGDYVITISPMSPPESPSLNFDVFFMIQ